MSKIDKMIAEEIDVEIDEAVKSISEAWDVYLERYEILKKLTAAKFCKHKWVDGGSSLLIVDKCTKCGYTRYV